MYCLATIVPNWIERQRDAGASIARQSGLLLHRHCSCTRRVSIKQASQRAMAGNGRKPDALVLWRA